MLFNNIESLVIYQLYPDLPVQFPLEVLSSKIIQDHIKNENLTFVSCQWGTLLRNSKSNNHPNLNDLPKIKFKNCFTITSADNHEPLIPYLVNMGIDTLFSPSATNKTYKNIKLLSIPYFAHDQYLPAANKNILYSFVGAATHKCRENIFNMKHPKNSVIIKRKKAHFVNPNQQETQNNNKEYCDVLGRSRFSLCPRGYGAGSFRFWESLQAGAIPVLIADDYILPTGFDWSSCIIRIKENEINKIPLIISKISKEHEKFLRNNCYIAYKKFSGDNLLSPVQDYYNK